jgi:phage shock protein C
MENECEHQDDTPAPTSQGPRPLRRPYEGRMLAGVASGIADHLGIDVTIVRILIAVLCVIGGAGVPLYIAGWLLIPDQGCNESIAAELLGHVH